MHEGMAGAHLFEITVESDSPVKPLQKIYLKAFWGDEAPAKAS